MYIYIYNYIYMYTYIYILHRHSYICISGYPLYSCGYAINLSEQCSKPLLVNDDDTGDYITHHIGDYNHPRTGNPELNQPV